MEPPVVFVSHASEDKDRFVLEFATKLRSQQGVDALVDKWEILPGDSLIDKIFEEGIGRAQAVIVVISEYSVEKPWVREELNAANVRRIEGASKLIPVAIGQVEDAQIPQSLKTVVWERIQNLEDYETEFHRIVRAIYGTPEKPPIGEAPSYANPSLDIVPGLSTVDSQVLEVCCAELIERDQSPLWFEPNEVFEVAKSRGIDKAGVQESIEILDGRGYLKASRVLGGGIYHFGVTDYGFDEYLRVKLDNYDGLTRAVGFEIVNHDTRSTWEIAEKLEQPAIIVGHILERFQNRGFIKMISAKTGPGKIISVSPELKRALQER